MPYLVISLGGEELSRHPLSGPAVVGRSVDADISVRDASMSRWHCRVEPAGDEDAGARPGDWVVVDLGSRNGSTVNGRKVTRHLLRHGDLLRVGRVTVYYSAEEFTPADPAAVLRATQRGTVPGRAGFVRPVPVPTPSLPRPQPVSGPGQSAADPSLSTPHLDVMSSPGWSRQVGKRKPPSPSVDVSPGELENRRQRTLDLNTPVPHRSVSRSALRRFFDTIGSMLRR